MDLGNLAWDLELDMLWFLLIPTYLIGNIGNPCVDNEYTHSVWSLVSSYLRMPDFLFCTIMEAVDIKHLK